MTHRYRLRVVEVSREVHEDVRDELGDVVGERVDEGAEPDHARVAAAHALGRLGLVAVGVLGLLQFAGRPLAEGLLQDG